MIDTTYQNVISQFPQYIVENPNYENFLSLVKEYYKFSSTYNILNEVDIDKTSFLDKFISTYAKNFPELNSLTPKQQKVVLLNLDDLYKSKGTPESYNLLFSLLYNKKIELVYPSEQIFKSSAATWNKDTAIRFVINSGIITSFNNILATISTSNNKITNVEILRINRVEGTSNVFEAILDIDYKLQIDSNLNATIETQTFTATLIKTITSKKIISQGRGFSVGDIYDININTSTGLKIKVTRVGNDGRLLAFQIIQFGINYNSDFQSSILSYFFRRDSEIEVELELNDNISQINENVILSTFDYIDNPNYYEDNTYVGNLISSTNQTTTSDGSTNSKISDNVAVIDFYLGYVLEYPGYHITNVGFPSDASYLQDGEYYQQFSYVIKSSKQYEEYKQALLNTVHVAGLKPFGEYTIQSYIDVLIEIENELSFLDISLNETFGVSDELSKIVIKNIQDNINILETISKNISKTVNLDTTSITDQAIKTITKRLSDNVSLSETLIKQLQKNIVDTTSISDINIKSVSKEISEDFNISETACAIINDGYFDIQEGLYWECGYTVNEILISG